MAVELEIRPHGLFRKKTTLAQLAEGLAWGVSDENYCLVPDKEGQNTVLYDPAHIGRGIEASFAADGAVHLRLPLPADERETALFYRLAERACALLGAKDYRRDGEKALPADNARLTALDCGASADAVQNFSQQIFTEDYQSFTVFGARIPLSIGREEVRQFGGDLARFGTWLDERQQLDAYYANPKVYRRADETLFGLYFLAAGVRSILPTRPYIVMDQIKGVGSWYIILGEKRLTVPYDRFFAAAAGEPFDANHIVVTMTQAQIDALSEFAVEI